MIPEARLPSGAFVFGCIGISHDQEVRSRLGVHHLPRGADEVARPLVLREQAEVADDQAIRRKAQPSPQRGELWSVFGHSRPKPGHVDAVGNAGNPFRCPRLAGGELLTGIRRTRHNAVGRGLDDALDHAKKLQPGTVRRQESMVHHLAGQAALIVEDQRHPPRARQRPANRGAFMQVPVHHVDGLPKTARQHHSGEQRVQQQLAPVRADARACLTAGRRQAHHAQPLRRGAARIGKNCDGVTLRLKRLGLLQDSHVTPVVREEPRRGDHGNVQAHARTLARSVR